jgi:hypothetical protein
VRQAEAPLVTEAPDPFEPDPSLLNELQVPGPVAAGEDDMPDFIRGAEAMAEGAARPVRQRPEGPHMRIWKSVGA